MYTNDKMVLQLVALLKKFKIRKIVVSPGSRHNKLIKSLEYDDYFQLHIVVDERSAAFYALGIIQSSGEAVAITCSSGTACINYGSAIVEAFYQRLPLLVLSSDRIPELLNQCEDQMYDQLSTFVKCTKYHCQLPVINTALDEWYCNRLINEALIELSHHGKGPVHINIPFYAHHGSNFNVPQLPDVRKVSLHQLPCEDKEWRSFADFLKDKKVMIIWGQSVSPLKETIQAENLFSKSYDAVVLTDVLSNCHTNNAILNTLLLLYRMKPKDVNRLQPDVVITIGGNYIFNGAIKEWLSHGQSLHWQVGMEDKICDPFHTLTDIFEMPESYFFKKLSEYTIKNSKNDYFEQWKRLSEEIIVPEVDYSELYAITKLLRNLPDNCDLQLANSQTVRIGNLVPLNKGIRVNCNRGVNGIDGSMSTAIGYAKECGKPLFYVTGELSFFYDMNSLSIKYLSPNIRILLINNEGGSIMWDSPRNTPLDNLPIYLAAGNKLTAKGWVESLGFRYLSAYNKQEVDEGVDILTDLSIGQPVLLEVFTNLSDDKFCISDFVKKLDDRTLCEKVYDKLCRKFK